MVKGLTAWKFVGPAQAVGPVELWPYHFLVGRIKKISPALACIFTHSSICSHLVYQALILMDPTKRQLIAVDSKVSKTHALAHNFGLYRSSCTVTTVDVGSISCALHCPEQVA